jgi:hypothetical protein
MENVNLFSGEVINGSPLDLGVTLSDGVTTLKNVAIWIGRRGNEFKLLVGGNATQAALYSKHLYLAEINGNLARVVSEKLLR